MIAILVIISNEECVKNVIKTISDMLPKSLKSHVAGNLAHLNICSLNSVTLNKNDQVRTLLEDKTIDVLELAET